MPPRLETPCDSVTSSQLLGDRMQLPWAMPATLHLVVLNRGNACALPIQGSSLLAKV